jgi:hypothetical protein
MLPPFIIEQIRKREEEEQRREANQPRLELPIDYPSAPVRRPSREEDEERDRGVVILDLGLEARTRAPHSRLHSLRFHD